MATAKDAIEIVTDPANLRAADDRHDEMRVVHERRAVDALRERGAGRAEARALGAEAVRELGGKVESQVDMGGVTAGGSRQRVVETWYVPTDKVRS